MKTRLVLVLPLALCLLTAACGKSERKPEAMGRGLFVSLGCRTCHRIGNEGGKGGPDLSLAGFRRNKEWLDLFLQNPQAWKNDTLMPNPRLSPKAREAVVAYLLSLKGQAFADGAAPWDKPEFQSDPVKRGAMIYSRAGCIACHGQDGSGGYPNNNVAGGKIPALQKVSESFTKEELVKKISRGVKPEKADANGPAPLVEMPAWGEVLDEKELDAVAEFLQRNSSARAQNSDW